MIDVYLGRENIFNPDLNTYAYEIMYNSNSSGENIVGKNSISAALSIIQTILDIGVANITQGKTAFFNLNGDFIKKQKNLPFSSELGGVILTINDDEIDETLINAVRRLKQLKYKVILDNVRINHLTVPLLHEIQGGRIDVCNYSRIAANDLLKSLNQYQIKYYADNVPDHQTLEFCKSVGFDYFQGPFFIKPQVMHGKRLPSRRLFVLKMLSSLYNPEIDIRDLEIIIRQDVSLGYKLMRMVNSAYYGLNSQIESIQHALVLLGINPLRAWLSVILLSEIDDQPGPLMSTAIIRGKMCELIAEMLPNEDISSYFVTGLFSILDTMMGLPMEEILQSIPMADSINKALLQGEGTLGSVLHSVIAYEQSNWQAINLPKVSIQQIREAYLKAIAWATELTNSNLL
ncbi:MAG: HDOD domain-containing protein [Anaerolineaceae bacterium]|nr:HDOD domain-containing protein [Anaerolineaceae bacterium]